MKNEEFEKYVADYDINNSKIHLKYYHTYRVVDYARKIAESENFNEHDIELAQTCGLLHDIARFSQARDFDTFNDKISFDHGDKGYEILLENDYIYKYVDNEEDKDIVLKAVKYHNKKYLEESLTDREKVFARIVRDADKLDIMDKQYNEITDNSTEFNKEAFQEVINYKLCTNKNVTNEATGVLRCIAFMFDLYYKESFNILNDNKIIDRKLELLRKYINKEQLNILEDLIDNFINRRTM